jgi:hypothetical protein
MTLTVSTENIYLAIIAFLMVMQIYQWRAINKLKSEIDSIWKQIHILTINVAAEILKLKPPTEIEKNKEKTS